MEGGVQGERTRGSHAAVPPVNKHGKSWSSRSGEAHRTHACSSPSKASFCMEIHLPLQINSPKVTNHVSLKSQF